jgi:hypothetical protein
LAKTSAGQAAHAMHQGLNPCRIEKIFTTMRVGRRRAVSIVLNPVPLNLPPGQEESPEQRTGTKLVGQRPEIVSSGPSIEQSSSRRPVSVTVYVGHLSEAVCSTCRE